LHWDLSPARRNRFPWPLPPAAASTIRASPARSRMSDEAAAHRVFTPTTSARAAGQGGFESHPPAAARRRPCQQVRRLWGRAYPCGQPDAYKVGSATVVLTGRATTMPFTTDASGRKRTPTDNPTATRACAVRRLARWRPHPIWLCKQGRGFESGLGPVG
jgi:hypothetical protein